MVDVVRSLGQTWKGLRDGLYMIVMIIDGFFLLGVDIEEYFSMRVLM